SISSVELCLKDQALFLCQTSTGNLTRVSCPLFVFTSKLTGIAIFSKFSIEITTPCLGSFLTYFIELIPWSKRQLYWNQPLQNQLKSSPATFSIVLKKSSGCGCLYAQRST